MVGEPVPHDLLQPRAQLYLSIRLAGRFPPFLFPDQDILPVEVEVLDLGTEDFRPSGAGQRGKAKHGIHVGVGRPLLDVLQEFHNLPFAEEQAAP